MSRVKVRQAGTWDPLLHCCNACTWKNVPQSNKIQRNYKGLKITACMYSWGKFWTKDIKKPQLPLLKSREQKQGVRSKSRVLHMRPALNTTKGVGRPPKPLPTAAAGAPIKPCLNFLSGLSSISIDWARPRILVGIKRNCQPLSLCPGILSTTPAGNCYCLHATSWPTFYSLAVCFNPPAPLKAHPKLPEKTYLFSTT